jgi:BirA family transcriptional regulator, biotin operon repressor / biotin---[acetyl-CoA-carboxylase] ligase
MRPHGRGHVRPLMDIRHTLFTLLADGQARSRSDLQARTGCDAVTLDAALQALRDAGLTIESADNQSIRCPHAFEVLDERNIRAQLTAHAAARLGALEIVFEAASTNQVLMEHKHGPGVNGRVLIAETQSAGRGRRGRRWMSPPGCGLWMSVARSLNVRADAMPALSLIAGIAVVRALERIGVAGAGLKWPNDIVHAGRKLGGILIESSAQGAGPVDTVVGIGLNVCLPRGAIQEIDQPATDLSRATGRDISRNRLAASILTELDAALDRAATQTDVPLDLWNKYDIAAGHAGVLLTPGGNVQGEILGVDARGMLLMRVDGKVQRYAGGDLSLRLSVDETTG